MRWRSPPRSRAGALQAQAMIKRAVDVGLEQPLADGLKLERDLFEAIFHTADSQVGVQSFLEHGPGKAEFTGSSHRRDARAVSSAQATRPISIGLIRSSWCGIGAHGDAVRAGFADRRTCPRTRRRRRASA